LCWRRAREVVVLAPPVDEPHAAVLAFLADGESWSSSALAVALGASQRTVQRALGALAAAGKVQRSVAGARVGGRPRPCPDSRRRCHSRVRCRTTRMDA
jgi:DeoR/GlpR family transcriptional regulator of sugar metabolism